MQAGELCAVEAIDREGLLVTSEGALVGCCAPPPKQPARDVRAPSARRSATPSGSSPPACAAGQSLQFYVHATPVRLDWLLEQSDADAQRALAALDPTAHGRADALRRLHGALRESLERHADEQAAVDVAYHVVVPYLPDQHPRVDWRALLPTRRRRLASAPLTRSLAAHRRVARESLHLTDQIRADLEALDLSTRLLSGPELVDLLWRRFNPDQRRPHTRTTRPAPDGLRSSASSTRSQTPATPRAPRTHVRELVAASAIDVPDQRHLRIDRDLEQAIYVATLPDATELGWLLDAMQVNRPFTLTVHVHALDRLRERARYKARHRRLFGVNRGAELRGRTPDYEMLAQEEEIGELLQELSGHERAGRLRGLDLPVDPRARPGPRRGRARRDRRARRPADHRRKRRPRQPRPAAPERAVAVHAAAGPRRRPADAQVRHPPRRRHDPARRHQLRLADRDPVCVHRPRPRGRAHQPLRPRARQRHAAGQRALRRRQDVPRQRPARAVPGARHAGLRARPRRALRVPLAGCPRRAASDDRRLR